MSGSPQLEDGFIRIANELLEAILAFGFTYREVLVLLTIIRKTYGFGKKTDDISASQIGDMCKIARPHVTSTLNALAQRNVISKRIGKFGSIIGIQKNHRLWIGADRLNTLATSTESVHSSTDSVHVLNQYASSTDSVHVDSTESVHTKDNLPKDNQQKKTSCAPQAERETVENPPAGKKDRRATTGINLQNRFDRFYSSYPKKKSRKAAERAFAKINPSDQQLELILAAIERAVKSEQWGDPQFIPHPASWLNAEGWADEIQTEYSAAELTVIRAYNEALGDQIGTVDEALFQESRAAAIRSFTTFSQKPNWIERYFPWVRDNTTLPPGVGFDFLISRKGFGNTSGGQHDRRAS